MTSAMLRRATRARVRQGMRPIDPRSDMAEVANLIELTFSSRMDAGARRIVHEMRTLGAAGRLGSILARLMLPPMAYPQGYVWEEAGRLVGNASLLSVDGYAARWVLANVAVDPDYRRQGIATRLVQGCVQLAKRNQARELVLQVDHDNQGAIDLYLQLGFEPCTIRTTWRRQAGMPVRGVRQRALVRRRKDDEWRRHWELALALLPEGVIWPYPLDQEWFRPRRFGWLLGLAHSRHWVIGAEAEPIRAALSARRSRDAASWRLWFLVQPTEAGSAERPLLEKALAALAPTNMSLAIDDPWRAAESDFAELGFQKRRTFMWMKLDLRGDHEQEESELHKGGQTARG